MMSLDNHTLKDMYEEQHRLTAVAAIANIDRLYDDYVIARELYNAAVHALHHGGEHDA